MESPDSTRVAACMGIWLCSTNRTYSTGHHFHEVLFIDALHFHGRIVIHQIEQGREAITQANTAAATVTNIKDALKLVIEFFFIVKI